MDSRCLRDLGRRGNRCICSAQTVDLGQSMDCLAQSVDRPLSIVCARQSMDCTSSRREAQAALTHLREVRPGAAEILSRLCLFVNSENSQLAKWCGLYSLSLSFSLSRPIGYGGPLTVGWQLRKDVSLISTGRQATAPNSLTGPLS